MEIAVDHRTPQLAPPPARVSSSGSPRDEALRGVLAELGERVKPVALARERTLRVSTPFEQLLPEGLVRGQVVSSQGVAARSVAFGLVRDALVEGGWMAVVDVSTLGTDAAAEFGVPLERVVRIETGADDGSGTDLDWIDVMGAAIDGFDVVLTRVPAGLRSGHRPAAVRKLGSRLQQKGAVVVTLGAAGSLGGDVEVTTRRTVWGGLGEGTGHLRRRVVEVVAAGRRVPGSRSCSIELAGEGTRVEFTRVADRDPQAEVLSEMAAMAETAAMTVVDLDDRCLAG